jgi:hypothetical protein
MKTPLRLRLLMQGLAILSISTMLLRAGDYACATNDGTIAIVRYTGSGGDVTIPGTVSGMPVVNIWSYAFQHCANLTNVTIPSSITEIGFDAFHACTNLLRITVDALNDAYCSVDGVLFDKSRILLILYPAARAGSYAILEGVAYIAGSALSYCSRLTTVTVPQSVMSIGMYSFSDCPNLTGVYFLGNPPSIGTGVFDNSSKVIVFYCSGTSSWGSTFAGRPTALWMLLSPVISASNPGCGVQSHGFVFSISAATNALIVVEACTDLADPEWVPLSTNIVTGDTSNYHDPDWIQHRARFYRVRQW